MASALKHARLPGDAAETLVVGRLQSMGWDILARRLRLGPLEIDILARLGDVVAIVEVRGRRISGWVTPLDSIDARKRQRLARAARRLWSERFALDESVRVLRIDLAAVTWSDGEPAIELVEGAVEVPPR